MVGRVSLLLLAALLPLEAYRLEGELSLVIRDPAGAPLAARVKLSSRAAGFAAESDTDDSGRWRARHLPFGFYAVEVSRGGFAGYAAQIEIRSEIPQLREITLGLEPIETAIQVHDSSSLVDPHQTGTVFQIQRRRLEEEPFSAPGRGVTGLLNTLPGWLMEANAVLHPRGSEYDTQYVIDGMPLADNRSPAFAPAIETDGLEAVHVFTANIPAEYGRRLGGVVELFTRRNDSPGHHPEINLRGGSFSSAESFVSDSFTAGRTSLYAGLRLGTTGRFLDPPAIENFTNHAGMAGATLRLDRELGPRDRLETYVHSNTVNFLVPNDPIQQQSGQRQDRRTRETAGRASFEHVFSSEVVANVRAMVRDLSAELWSNPLSTPVLAAQDRGFLEGYTAASFTVQKRAHLMKFGADAQAAALHENFSYLDRSENSFRFHDRRRSREFGVFAQDRWQHGPLTLDYGLRWDDYRLLAKESAWSPRLGAAYYWARAGMVIHGSYDRAFQTPAIENLLLTGALEGLPMRPSRANFYEIGVRKSVWQVARLEVNHFWRRFREFADDEVFLNTGVSFPVAFSRARINGTEVRIEIPGWRGLSGFASWSNQIGSGDLPLTGGLFLGKDPAELRGSGRFAISQDQRNTARAQVRWQMRPRLWVAAGSQYSSGLPVELEPGAGRDDFEHSFSPRILDRVNFARGRVRPGFSWDFSGGVDLWRREKRSVRLQVDLLNAANRLNLINFSGLFSGTAIAAPRTVGAQLRTQF